MNLHANARLSLEGRELLIERVEHAPRGGPLSVNVRRDAHHRGINDLEGENGERRTCWSRARMELRVRLPPATKPI